MFYTYSINTKVISRIVDLNRSYVRALFKINNEIYAELNNNTHSLQKLVQKNDIYSLDTVLEYESLSCETKTYHNWFCCYYNRNQEFTSQPLYTISVYDFTKQTSNIVVNNCKGLKNDGVFKPKWINSSSDFIVIGEWLYYIHDDTIYDFSSKKDRRTSHIYRLNLHTPMRAVDLGEALQI